MDPDFLGQRGPAATSPRVTLRSSGSGGSRTPPCTSERSVSRHPPSLQRPARPGPAHSARAELCFSPVGPYRDPSTRPIPSRRRHLLLRADHPALSILPIASARRGARAGNLGGPRRPGAPRPLPRRQRTLHLSAAPKCPRRIGTARLARRVVSGWPGEWRPVEQLKRVATVDPQTEAAYRRPRLMALPSAEQKSLALCAARRPQRAGATTHRRAPWGPESKTTNPRVPRACHAVRTVCEGCREF